MSEILVSELSAAAEGNQLDRFSIVNSLRHPYRFVPISPDRDLDPVWRAEIFDHTSSGKIFVANVGGEVVGVVVCADLPWDTRILGDQMGAVKYLLIRPEHPDRGRVIDRLLDRVVGWASDRAIDCLVCKTFSDDVEVIHALERQGFLLMDTLLIYVSDLQQNPTATIPPPPLDAQFVIRPAEDEVDELMALAQAAFQGHFGRYHSDRRIARGQATRIYEEWMRSSIEGYADSILVAEAEGRIAGCSIWKEPSPLERKLGLRLGHYSIGLVHPDFYRRGLFTALTYAGMARLDESVDYIEGPTHVNNYAVQRGYTKLRWRIHDARHSFHKWLR
jgi:RimJ/RimL family protein N-acetyltransferase